MMTGIKSIKQNQAMFAEDDAAKKNTDCVYFVASPLTCKKGSECEYRHNEHARVNPRDCWYWLNGSCLNPKCAFRHPPLDGLLGSQSAVSAGTTFSLPQAPAPSSLVAHQSKQPVPCIFFQKGLCLKGDKCAFLHGPSSVTTKHPQVATPAAEISGPKIVFGNPQRSAQEPKLYQPTISNRNKFTDVKLDRKMSDAQTEAGAATGVVPSRGFNAKSLSNKSTTIAPPSKDMYQVEIPVDFIMRNGKDADDLYRESSPGFDVLVDNELAEDQYYDVDQYSTRGDNEGRNVDADREMIHVPRGYDVHDRLASQHSRHQNRRSSNRTSRGADSLERWNDHNGGSFERIGQSDLRNRLKLKKESGLRSVISNDCAHDNHDRRSGDSRRASRPVAPLEVLLSNRLQGRIRDPRRSPVRGTVSGRDFEMGRNLNGTSSVRTQIRDRIGSRMQDDFGSERNLRGLGEFSGPKRLSELKPCKSSVKDHLISGQELFSLGKRKNSGENEQQNSHLSFEGPKPLSEILKRKRRSEANAPVSGPSENKETDNTQRTENTDINKEAYNSVTDASGKKIELDDLHSSGATETDQNEQEDGILAGEEMEDQNLEEGYEQGEDGEEYYYYEEDEGEYNVEEGENAEGDEYVEEDGGALENKIDSTFS